MCYLKEIFIDDTLAEILTCPICNSILCIDSVQVYNYNYF